MKILCLNTWYGGKLTKEITQFFQLHAGSVDIFCLQETVDAFDTIVEPFFDSYTRIQHTKSISERESFALSMLIRKDIKIHAHGTILAAIPKTGLDQWIIVERGNEKYWVCNFHGIAYPGEKEDNSERLFGSRTLIEESMRHTLPRIIMGDFNLLPSTESITMFSKEGYRDLIKEYAIPTTRNEHAWNRYPEKKLLHSDYVFVTDDARVDNFSILPDIVSDHLPLVLEVGTE